jgi:NSS family neurotransmitter:Na+ symporter
METVVSIIQDKFHIERKVTCLIVLFGAFAIGVPSALGFGVWSGVTPLKMDILSFFDFITNSLLMPIVAILTCIVVCYVMRPKDVIDEIALTGKFKLAGLFKGMIYVAPLFLVVILVFAIFEAFGIDFGGYLKF